MSFAWSPSRGSFRSHFTTCLLLLSTYLCTICTNLCSLFPTLDITRESPFPHFSAKIATARYIIIATQASGGTSTPPSRLVTPTSSLCLELKPGLAFTFHSFPTTTTVTTPNRRCSILASYVLGFTSSYTAYYPTRSSRCPPDYPICGAVAQSPHISLSLELTLSSVLVLGRTLAPPISSHGIACARSSNLLASFILDTRVKP